MINTTSRVQQHRNRLRKAGLRPIQIWVPDTRAPGFAAECHKQSQAVADSDEANTQLTHMMENALDSIEGWQ